MSQAAAESREILGIVRCPRCDEDTIPCERTGRCFFCDTKLVDPPPRIRARVLQFPEAQRVCDCGHPSGMHDHTGRCFDCPCATFAEAL
jgi:hypothetical protein